MMAHDASPDKLPGHQSEVAVTGWCLLKRLLILAATGSIGIVLGSYISAELVYVHYPNEPRLVRDVYSHTVEAVTSSPLSMTFGVLPSLGFYHLHGYLALLGALMAICGSAFYFACGERLLLIVVVVGFVLWSHNNFLVFNALMSV